MLQDFEAITAGLPPDRIIIYEYITWKIQEWGRSKQEMDAAF